MYDFMLSGDMTLDIFIAAGDNINLSYIEG